jgi:hypothetical protein
MDNLKAWLLTPANWPIMLGWLFVGLMAVLVLYEGASYEDDHSTHSKN